MLCVSCVLKGFQNEVRNDQHLHVHHFHLYLTVLTIPMWLIYKWLQILQSCLKIVVTILFYVIVLYRDGLVLKLRNQLLIKLLKN